MGKYWNITDPVRLAQVREQAARARAARKPPICSVAAAKAIRAYHVRVGHNVKDPTPEELGMIRSRSGCEAVSTAEQRHLGARLAALASHAKYPPGERTRALRAGFEEQFIRQARDLHPDLPDVDIARVAATLRKAHFTRLSLAAANARARKAAR